MSHARHRIPVPAAETRKHGEKRMGDARRVLQSGRGILGVEPIPKSLGSVGTASWLHTEFHKARPSIRDGVPACYMEATQTIRSRSCWKTARLAHRRPATQSHFCKNAA